MKKLKTYKQLFEVKINKGLAVHMMVYNNEFEKLQNYLDNGGDINILDNQNNNLLHTAAFYNNIEMCKFLINNDIDINSVCLSSLLIGDSNDRHYDVIKYLLGNGIDIYNKCSIYYKPVLCYTSKSPKTTQLLIDYGIALDDVDEYKQTALMCAVMDDRLDVVKILINAGANYNYIDNNGRNCLFSIKYGHSVELIEYLINVGVDYNHVDDSGEDFFDYLIDLGYQYNRLTKYSKKYFNYLKQHKQKKFNI
jgi:ankyrin repeat protein